MERVDLLIRNADWVFTMNPERHLIRNGAIAIRGDRIVAVGKSDDLTAQFSPTEVIEGENRVVLPGLVDAHVHTAFHLSRGLADEVSSQKFLFERMYPYEGALSDEETYWASMLCVLEEIRAGVTTFIDAGNYAPEQSIAAVAQGGIRCIMSESTFDLTKSAMGVLPDAWIQTTEQCLERSEAFVDKWHGKHEGRIRAWYQFRGVNNASDRLIEGLFERARRDRTGVQTHACFAKETLESSLSQHGLPEVRRLARIGALGPNVLLVHSGWLTPDELGLVVKHDCKVTCAPSSSLHNGYGCILQGSIPELIEMGVAVGLGSDHASSGIVDLTQEMFLAAGGYKEVRLNTTVMPPERLVEMATINGARCALWDEEIGSLEPGKKADIVLFNTRLPQWQPLYNPVANLVYSANGSSVDTVICNGRIVMAGRKVLTINEDEVIDQIDRLKESVLEKTKLREKVLPRWPIL